MSASAPAPAPGFHVVRTYSRTDKRYLLSVESRPFTWPTPELREHALRAAWDWCKFVRQYENPTGSEYTVIEVLHEPE